MAGDWMGQARRWVPVRDIRGPGWATPGTPGGAARELEPGQCWVTFGTQSGLPWQRRPVWELKRRKNMGGLSLGVPRNMGTQAEHKNDGWVARLCGGVGAKTVW